MSKSNSTPASPYVYIAFHLRNSVNASADAARIGTLLNKVFGIEQVESIDLNVQDREVIYRVNKPVLADREDQVAFFEALDRLLEGTEEYTPHFTQIHS